jgi:hypothetical protein
MPAVAASALVTAEAAPFGQAARNFSSAGAEQRFAFGRGPVTDATALWRFGHIVVAIEPDVAIAFPAGGLTLRAGGFHPETG